MVLKALGSSMIDSANTTAWQDQAGARMTEPFKYPPSQPEAELAFYIEQTACSDPKSGIVTAWLKALSQYQKRTKRFKMMKYGLGQRSQRGNVLGHAWLE